MTAARTFAVLGALLRDARVGWSLGRAGAIAEFYWDDDEPIARDAQSIATPRGALHLAPEGSEARLFAGETLNHAGNGWTQWLSLCLPKTECAMLGHTSIAEIGPDRYALRAESRQALLFDLGIGGPHFQLSVRTESPALIRELRAFAGQPLLSAPALLRSLVVDSPARVFESRVARIEVTQPIAPAGAQSPKGPHTHLLPNLIRGDGTESASAPAGWVAQIVAYPANPLHDTRGQRKPFDADAYEAFQHWLGEFGDPGHLSLKRRVADAVRSGASPDTLSGDAGRIESVRIALRQLRCLEGASVALTRWHEAYDPA